MDYICDRDTYLRVREAQKNMMNERQHNTIAEAYEAAYSKWQLARPAEVKESIQTTCKECGHTYFERNPKYAVYKQLYDAWRTQCPPNPIYEFTAYAARHLNIFYAILKGKKYFQVEQKTREGNGFDVDALVKLCKTYNVDFQKFCLKMNGE